MPNRTIRSRSGDGDYEPLVVTNDPLAKVLQHALKNSIFVQDVHCFLKQYGGDQHRVLAEHIWVYYEAQRAWDAERVVQKRGHATSEPEDFLRICERLDSWALMVVLIGDGQKIQTDATSATASSAGFARHRDV